MARLRKDVGELLVERSDSTNDLVAAAYLLARLAETEEEREGVIASLRGRLVGRMEEAQKVDDFHRLWDKQGDVLLELLHGQDGMGV